MSLPTPQNVDMSQPIPETSAVYTPCSYVPMTPAARRRTLLRDIDVVLDVGANRGQYAGWVRSLGFPGRIISFEPQSTAYQTLSQAASNDERWECHNLALGPSDGDLELQVSNDDRATSVFKPTVEALRTFPDNYVTGVEPVPMRSLGSLWPELGCNGRVYLKVDVEGFELSVLEGAERALRNVSLVELELSVVPNYSGAPVIQDVFRFLGERGFAPVALEQSGGDDHKTGEQMMCDGIFRTTTHLDNASAGRA